MDVRNNETSPSKAKVGIVVDKAECGVVALLAFTRRAAHMRTLQYYTVGTVIPFLSYK